MNQICARIRLRGADKKYRKVLSTDKDVYTIPAALPESAIPYAPQTLVDDGEWFSLAKFFESSFAIDLIKEKFDSADFDMLESCFFEKIDYVLVMMQKAICFQSVSKSHLIHKKGIIHKGEKFEYEPESARITINETPDAIYDKNKDCLYFQKLSAITRMFKGIDQLYREATESEVNDFLAASFISLKNDFNSGCVKTANRKRIALAKDTLKSFSDSDRGTVFKYIGDYCPELKSSEDSFEIGSEEELKLLLFGIEQRFYTTPVGSEKRIANSVISM